ncbi:unnamed protein product [Lampetra fluviatilis]
MDIHRMFQEGAHGVRDDGNTGGEAHRRGSESVRTVPGGSSRRSDHGVREVQAKKLRSLTGGARPAAGETSQVSAADTRTPERTERPGQSGTGTRSSRTET